MIKISVLPQNRFCSSSNNYIKPLPSLIPIVFCLGNIILGLNDEWKFTTPSLK